MLSDRLSVIASALSTDPRQSPRLARLAGFKGLLFDAWSSNLNIPDLSASGRRDFLAMLRAQDQKLVGLRMDLGPKGLGIGADIDRQISRIDRAMEAAAELQSLLVCVDLGPLPRAMVAPKPKSAIPPDQAGAIIIPTPAAAPAPVTASPPPDPAFVSQVNAALMEIGARADRYAVIVAFSSSLASFASLNESLAAARCPWFGIDLDPVAILRDDMSADEIFSLLGPLIRHVRARDAIVGDDKRVKPAVIGQGSTDWAQFLALLDEAGYSGFITIDPMELPDRAAAARSGLNYLNKLR